MHNDIQLWFLVIGALELIGLVCTLILFGHRIKNVEQKAENSQVVIESARTSTERLYETTNQRISEHVQSPRMHTK